MILSDGNILVRPLQLDDAQQLFEAARESIREMSPWLPWCHDNYAIEETREYLAVRVNDKTEEEAYGFGIFDRSTRKFLGGVGLNHCRSVCFRRRLWLLIRRQAVQTTAYNTSSHREFQSEIQENGC